MVFWDDGVNWISWRRRAGWTRGSYYERVRNIQDTRDIEHTPSTRVSWKESALSATVCILLAGRAGKGGAGEKKESEKEEWGN
jgi:hypothetical protein